MGWLWFGVVLFHGGLSVLAYMLRRRRKTFDAHVDDALDVFREDLPPHSCEVREDLTDEAADYGFSEIVNDALSPADHRRFKRLGGLFGIQPPMIPGREDQ